jgi:hypothetical protein
MPVIEKHLLLIGDIVVIGGGRAEAEAGSEITTSQSAQLKSLKLNSVD